MIPHTVHVRKWAVPGARFLSHTALPLLRALPFAGPRSRQSEHKIRSISTRHRPPSRNGFQRVHALAAGAQTSAERVYVPQLLARQYFLLTASRSMAKRTDVNFIAGDKFLYGLCVCRPHAHRNRLSDAQDGTLEVI